MRVLVVVETTNYELHGPGIETKVAAGRIATDALSRLKTAHDEHYRTLEQLRAKLRRESFAFDEISRDGDTLVARSADGAEARLHTDGSGPAYEIFRTAPDGTRSSIFHDALKDSLPVIRRE